MVSAAAGYGVDPLDPICVGGGLVFGTFNEGLYLQSLRGPDGAPVTFERVGSTPRADAPPLDIYAVSSGGVSTVQHLYLDMYQPMNESQPPTGFTFESPLGPPRLPISTVSGFLQPGETSGGPAERQRRWRIVDQQGDTLGFATWDGQDSVEIDLMANLAARVREHLDRALAVTPAEQRAVVLDDFFERFLVLTSAGLVDARRDDEPLGPKPWHGPVWGCPVRGPARARRSFRGDRRRSRVEGRSAVAVAALFVLVPVVVSAYAVRQARDDIVPLVLIAIVGAYVTAQCGRAFITLLFAPVYPRETYYGSADIAPESGDRAAVWRRDLIVAAPLVLVVAVALAWSVSGHIGLAALVCAPVAIVFIVAGSKQKASLHPDRAVALEHELRGRYVLYLRNFRGARPATAAACLAASAPHLMAMIVSPHRRESRSPSWYLLAILMPRAFARLRLWSTDDVEWDRVVASCMARSVGILVDATGSSPQRDADGLTLETAISLGFAGEHPTAYAVDPAKRLSVRVPAPATLHVGAGLGWTLSHHRALVQRLRAVINRSLSDEENAYLEQFYRSLKERWADAIVQDGNHAQRLGMPDPQTLLHMRRDKRPVPNDRRASAGTGGPGGTPE
jgi:hypothetical protein